MSVGPRITLGDGVTVDALLDALTDHPRRLPDAFVGVPAGGWEQATARHPQTVGDDGHWRLPVYAYLVRTASHTVLVDAGVGPAGTVAAEWLGTEGVLDERLAALGVDRGSIDVVFFTHLHEDHVGWGADPTTGSLTFGRARYTVADEEWSTERARGVRRHVEHGLGPARDAGRLEPMAPGPFLPGIEILALPGHTAGHCGVLVQGQTGVVLLAGDAFSHPVQLSEPGIGSSADADPQRAAETRRLVLERAASEDCLVGSAHLPGGWWRAAWDARQRRGGQATDRHAQ